MKKETLGDLLTSYPSEKADDTCLIFLDEEGKERAVFTRESLKRQALVLAQGLMTCTQPSDKVLIAMEDQAAFALGFFGCILAGRIPVPLPPLRNKYYQAAYGRVHTLLQSRQVQHVWMDEKHTSWLRQRLDEAGIGHAQLLTSQALKTASISRVSLPDSAPDQLAYIQYTSGSTADPKGIALTHRQVLHNLAKIRRDFAADEKLIIAGWIPFHHDMGLVGHLLGDYFVGEWGYFSRQLLL